MQPRSVEPATFLAAVRCTDTACTAVPQESKQEALDWEHRFLSQFDYAWNRRCNAGARHVALRQVTKPPAQPG